MDKKDFITIIEKLDDKFDTHKFIEKYISLFEKKYVDLLYLNIESKNGIFKAAHSQIGKFLSNNSPYFNIEKEDKGISENIKKYDSENRKWRKIL